MVFKSFSPLYHSSFFDTWGRNDFFINFEHIWENAKAYDFIGNFTQQGKLGGYSQGVYLMSELSALIVLLFDVPIVDDLAKLNSLKFMFFFLYIFASYGSYLFFRHGLRLPYLPSFIGGLAYIFGNAVFLAYLGNEYSIHQMQYIFLPWAFLLIKLSHRHCSLLLASIGGLVASLSEYAMSSHPEIDLVYFTICNSYNFYLSIINCISKPRSLKNVTYFLKWVLTFPFFHGVGLAYRGVPFVDAIAKKEFSLLDNMGSGVDSLGLWWIGKLEHYSTIFFRYWDIEKIGTYLVNSANGTLVTFYTGPFSVFMVFVLFFFMLLSALKTKGYLNKMDFQFAKFEDKLFFILIFLFLAINLPMGNQSPLDKIMKWSGFIRIHNIDRINIFFIFFILTLALFGLTWILKQKNLLLLIATLITYLLTLGVVYFSPITPAMPDMVWYDTKILIATFTTALIYIFIKNYLSSKSSRLSLAYLTSLQLIIIIISFTSYFTICGRCKEFVNSFKNPTIRNHVTEQFFSFRTALTQYRNNQHDEPSYDYLKQRAEQFVLDIDHDKARGVYSEEFSKEKYFSAKWIMAKNSSKIQRLEAIAPYLDNYYFFRGKSHVGVGASTVYYGPLAYGVYNGFQFHLPDRYQLLIQYLGGSVASTLPVGKNSEISAGLFYGLGPAYPSIDVNSHLRGLYHDSLGHFKRSSGYDYNIQPMELKNIKLKSNVKKLMNIYGVDFIYFHDYYLTSLPSPQNTLNFLQAKGFKAYQLPDSFTFAPRFGNAYDFHIFENPQSYGKAYIARWVQAIDPSENLARKSISELSRTWPRSKLLINNFEKLMSLIPENYWRAAIIEAKQEDNHRPPSWVSQSEKNSVTIKKILATKAVFDVDCQEQTCWFVYNSAALDGWKAYTGKKPLDIYKANLGFIGVKLEHGKHLLWMEYRPLPPIIGLILTCSGWILVIYFYITSSHRLNSITCSTKANPKALLC